MRRFEPKGSDGGSSCMDIEIDEAAGLVRVYDPRAFHVGRRAFCERLLEATKGQPGIHRVEINSEAATCQLVFEPGSFNAKAMASAFSNAVRQAAEDPQSRVRSRWWRHSRRWSVLTAYRHIGDVSLWESLETKPGRLRLRHAGLSGDRARLAQLAESLSEMDGVGVARLFPWSRAITLDFPPDTFPTSRLLDEVEQVFESCKSQSTRPRRSRNSSNDIETAPEVAQGAQRLLYLTLGLGSLALTVVGLVVPGIPTVPFLLASSYFLARSSPKLDAKLRRTAFLGPILREWETHHALSLTSKKKLAGLTLAVVVLTVAVTSLEPSVVALIVVIAAVSLWGIARLPEIEADSRNGHAPANGLLDGLALSAR
jgi:uncharacterized membrane protein YbaN (DUF454 family)